jgi:hypothetical protein
MKYVCLGTISMVLVLCMGIKACMEPPETPSSILPTTSKQYSSSAEEEKAGLQSQSGWDAQSQAQHRHSRSMASSSSSQERRSPTPVAIGEGTRKRIGGCGRLYRVVSRNLWLIARVAIIWYIFLVWTG